MSGIDFSPAAHKLFLGLWYDGQKHDPKLYECRTAEIAKCTVKKGIQI